MKTQTPVKNAPSLNTETDEDDAPVDDFVGFLCAKNTERIDSSVRGREMSMLTRPTLNTHHQQWAHIISTGNIHHISFF